MKTIDFSYFIERYNAGEMDDAEKQWFTKELKDNEKLRKEVELRRVTDTILKNQDQMNLRNKLVLLGCFNCKAAYFFINSRGNNTRKDH